MDLSDHPGAVQKAGIPFRRVLRESNSPYWEAALADPAHAVDYLIAFPGDEAWYALRRSQQGLKLVATVNSGWQSAFVYRSLLR
jgi:hypothetical protein